MKYVDSKHGEVQKDPKHKGQGRPLTIMCFALIAVAYSCYSKLSNRLFVEPSPSLDPYSDTDLPLRTALEPWDISSSYSYTKRLHKNVSEGTWIRITAHPKRDEIVFELLGDLYCMVTPRDLADPILTEKATPILTGIPYEKDASFSPDGESIVFISDATFGVDNIWTMPYTQCEDMGKRSEKGLNRRSTYQHTNSTLRFFSSPGFHPTKLMFIATKWYLTIRPNGGGEIWEIPFNNEKTTILPEHGGQRVIGRQLPRGWTSNMYGLNQIGPEQGRYTGAKGDGIVYAKNTVDLDGVSEYSKDVHKGVYSIFMYNTTTHVTKKLVDAMPGGANMPRVSHDGQTLAFVRRFREKSVLVVQHITSGTLHYIWYELTYDLSLIHAPMGSYPSYSFNHDDSAIIIWSSGQIYQVPLKKDHLGERVLASPPVNLPFTAELDIRLAETCYSETDIRKVELAEIATISAFRGLRPDHSGSQVLFEAAGVNYVQSVVGGTNGTAPPPVRLPTIDKDAMYYSANWFSRSSELVIQAKWSQVNLTSFEVADIKTGHILPIEGLPKGRYISPVVSATTYSSTEEYIHRIAFVRTGADYMLGDVQETAGAGIWLAELWRHRDNISVRDLVHIADRQGQDIKLIFEEDGKLLLCQEAASITAFHLDGKDDYRPHLLQSGKTSMEMVVSKDWVAIKDFQQAYIAPFLQSSGKAIWSKPGHGPKGMKRLSLDGAHDLFFSGDGDWIFWFLGPYLHHAKTLDLAMCDEAARGDARDYGIACVTNLVSYQKVIVTMETDIARLKRENATMAIVHATIVPMDGRRDDPRVIHNGTILVEDGLITAVGDVVEVPAFAKVIDAKGGVVIPGLVDVHGHWGGFLSLYPSASWELETFLGYGITTIHNPSSKNVNGYVERNLVERGAMFGPRIYHTGDVFYGSTQPAVYTEINSLGDARQALLRVKVEGQESSFSVKNYQLSPRSARQRLLVEAQKLGMLVYPEGGFSFDWDLTYLIDGMSSIEHPIPVPELFDDVLSLYEVSSSSYTQIAVMHYGGIFAKQWVWQNNYFPENRKLRYYLKHNHLDTLAEVKQAPSYSYQVWNTTNSARKLAERGIRTNIGSHGEQPIGFLYHSEMQFLKAGGQNEYETLWAATMGGATSLGLQSAIGSIAVGKMADLVIYPSEITSLEQWWAKSMEMEYVMRGGRLFSVAEGLVEEWPNKGRRFLKGRVNPESEDNLF